MKRDYHIPKRDRLKRRRHFQGRFHSWTMFFNGLRSTKKHAASPPWIEYTEQVSRVTGKGVSLVEGFLIYHAPFSAQLIHVSGGQPPCPSPMQVPALRQENPF